MSLTNPNKIVTEERLSDFYQGILPYLGGMPEVLANKFSKSDLYSTDEKMIGQWVDGKPLYQKTFIINNLVNGQNLSPHNISNLDTVVFLNGMGGQGRSIPYVYAVNHSTNADYYAGCDITGNDLRIEIGVGFSMETTKAYITIKYTKTTDSAISIGSDTDYSTTEKIIGTWIDGKPIYQKSIQVTSNITLKSSGYTTVFTAPSNISKVINITTTYQTMLYLAYPNILNVGQWAMAGDYGVVVPSGTIMTLQYTKTTD